MIKNKIPLSEGKIKGGLKDKDLYQVWKINFKPEEDEYTPKIELAILMEKQGLMEGAYRSLCFCNSSQLQCFINNLTKALVFFMKKEKVINPQNFNYRLNQFLKLAEKTFRGN